MSAQKLEQVFGYVEERCLWQFGARSRDREESIGGVIAAATALLTGEPPKLDGPLQRLHYADAKIMVGDLRERFAWIGTASANELRSLMDDLKAKLLDVTITRSQNRELNHSLY